MKFDIKLYGFIRSLTLNNYEVRLITTWGRHGYWHPGGGQYPLGQWRSKRGMGACALGCRPWWRNSTLYAVILNVFLSKNLDQNMLKNACFLEKTVKIVSASGDPPPKLRLLRRLGYLRVATPIYYYNFVEFVSSAKCILFRSKKKRNYCKCSAFASCALLHLLFNSNSVSFAEGRRKNISCPTAQGTLAAPLHWALSYYLAYRPLVQNETQFRFGTGWKMVEIGDVKPLTVTFKLQHHKIVISMLIFMHY